MVDRVARSQCALLVVLAITTPWNHVSTASPVSPAAAAASSDVDLLMPSVQPKVVYTYVSMIELSFHFLCAALFIILYLAHNLYHVYDFHNK